MCVSLGRCHFIEHSIICVIRYMLSTTVLINPIYSATLLQYSGNIHKLGECLLLCGSSACNVRVLCHSISY